MLAPAAQNSPATSSGGTTKSPIAPRILRSPRISSLVDADNDRMSDPHGEHRPQRYDYPAGWRPPPSGPRLMLRVHRRRTTPPIPERGAALPGDHRHFRPTGHVLGRRPDPQIPARFHDGRHRRPTRSVRATIAHRSPPQSGPGRGDLPSRGRPRSIEGPSIRPLGTGLRPLSRSRARP